MCDKGKRQTIFQFMKEANIDIVMPQETFVTDVSEVVFDRNWGKTFHSVSNTSHSRGVSTK